MNLRIDELAGKAARSVARRTRCRVAVGAAMICLLALNAQLSTIFAQGTAFTYQGRLDDGTAPATGIYDLRFTIFSSIDVPGTVVAGPVTNTATSLSNGLFTVVLDYGAAPWDGSARWLEIGVRTNGGGAFNTLGPRQQITSAPYAVRAETAASAGSVAAANITGRISLAQLPPTVVTNGTSGLNLSGTLSGDGAGLTNVSLTTLNSGLAITFPGNFVAASPLSVGAGPFALTAADVNGDGKVDLITVNDALNTLSILTNNGNGGFTLAATPQVGGAPESVVAVDVNGDGKVDLVCANYLGNTLSVLTNNGNGGFALASSPVVGRSPVSLIAADLNRDGKMDLVCANYEDNTLTVLLNNGNGAFVPSCLPKVGVGPAGVVAVDVNGDGYPDLISADAGSQTLTVLANNGSGTFFYPASAPILVGPISSVIAVDVNGDGRLDLVTAGSVNLGVWLNNGSGAFTTVEWLSVGLEPESVTAADVNGDGKVDLICANYGANTLSILTNDSHGGFRPASSPATGSGPLSVVAVDVNGDGKVDLVSANYNDNTLSVFFNTPAFLGSFNGNGSGLSNLNAAGITGTLGTAQIPDLDASKLTTGTLDDARLSGNVPRLDGFQTFTGDNTFANININPASALSFGANTRQMLNLWGNYYGIGVQSYTMYFRTDNGFSWFKGGMHENRQNNAGGGVEMMRLDGAGNLRTLTGTIAPLSDRNAKMKLEPVNTREVLDRVAALPLARWSYKTDPNSRHLGPMAQDFYKAFEIGLDDKSICTVDADGVALAAIQGLNQKLTQVLAQQEAENANLKQRNDALEKRLRALEDAVLPDIGRR